MYNKATGNGDIEYDDNDVDDDTCIIGSDKRT
jgi:hypothetical protein